ncbi:MAG: IS630 family transposase [Chloroflexi bacterium]|nr:IS630 family transposase [Chloroflexota bacterium]
MENPACSKPGDHGLSLTHWSARTLQREVTRQEIIDTIHYRTVARILAAATLQPHRWRYWKTTVWNESAIQRAIRVLWCYERLDWLLERGILVVCLDEKPNLQVLERDGPVRLMIPGQVEQQEFDYVRHGIVNFLAAMTLHNGLLWSECLERNDSESFRPAVQRLLDKYSWAQGIYLVMDNGASHIAGETLAMLASRKPWVRVRLTPPRASWLNQAELLLRAFSARYVNRGHWDARQTMIEHLDASSREYNALWAHPFSWSWTRNRFDDWLRVCDFIEIGGKNGL